MVSLRRAALIALLAVVLPSVVTVMVMSPSTLRRFPPRTDAHHAPNPRTAAGLAYEAVEFPSRDGGGRAMVRGWFVPGPPAVDGAPRAGVVAVHGAGRDRNQLLPYLRLLHAGARADVLLLDTQGSGLSDARGWGLGYGYREHSDVLDAAAWLRGRLGAGARVVALGTSAGGAATIRAAAEDARAEERLLDAIVTVGSFGTLAGVFDDVPPDLWNFLAGRLRERFPAAAPHLRRAAAWLARASMPLVAWAVGESDAESPLAAVARVPHPHLIVHGSHDGLVHVDHSRGLYEAAAHPKELHIVSHGSHNAVHLLHKCADYRAKLLEAVRPSGA